ncbi:MAG TPA: Arc family DNA-binding protein [Candidatus Aminicenantes bacterium]|nr:Arc family DNA-binding protein [Candidatus Aminicenantes bacterium]HDT12906.1 Arc family DNA-binding protein [Candidatus Aminicenantes bacterium]
MAMNYTLKNIPDEIYKKIKLRARRHRRSVNSEIIAILGEVTTPRRVSPEEFLARADELRARTKGFLTEEFLKKVKREGLL